MEVKCRFCGKMISAAAEQCPNCGGINYDIVRTASAQPHTIAEFQEWYEEKGLPPYEVTRFFIGENCIEPRAFGVYRDDEKKVFTAYKNLSSGERVVRYEGTDEEYAVNVIFQRLKDEIIQQKMLKAKKK